MPVESVAFVGVVGGAGTTRSVVELAGVLARGGRSALILDLDFATQGLERYIEDSMDPDSSSLLADPDVPLESAVHDWEVDGSGRLGVVPAFAPFARIARAKSPEAGRLVGDRTEEATEQFDHVLLDVPPIVSNQSVGAVHAAESVTAVIPPTERGVDSLQRERGRIADVETELDHVLTVGTSPDSAPIDADLAIPSLPTSNPPYRPLSLESSGGFTAQVANVADSIFEVDVADAIDAEASMFGRVARELKG